jgi:phosphatidylserine/phosphatidylglycerophosphate/cardiolipin synthase-like enzyme
VDARVGVQPDDGPAELVDLIYSATRSVDVAIYLIGDNNDVFDALAEMAAEVDVRVIVDSGETYQSTRDRLEDAGAQTHVQPDEFGDDGDQYPGPFYHIKLVVVDGERTWFSNGNLLEPYMSTERNYEVYDDDPQDAEDLQELFDADWEGRSPDLDCARIVVSPESSRDRLLDLIDGATESLVFETMQFADTDTRDAVAARVAAGVDVRVLLAHPEWITTNYDAADFLAGIGAEVRYYASWDLHAKMTLVDGERAYVGSQNFTWTSIERNREVGAFLTEPDAIDVISATFENDWDDGADF